MNNVLDFGARGDGIAKDTAPVQAALDAGGIVFFPPGTYLCGTLYLRSNGGLELSPGAVLLASPDREDYNADDFCPQNRVAGQEKVSGAHFIVALEAENVTIRGGGRIDGSREAFYSDWTPGNRDFNITSWRPGQMLYFCESRNIHLEDVQLYNAPYWTCFLHGCEDVFVKGLRIYNDQRTANGDGIDIDCCRRVTASDCIIDSGDDCITLRGNSAPLKNKGACEHIAITNCILHTCCNAIRIGVGNGIVRDCVISNIVFHETRTAICIVSNYLSDKSKGVQIEDILFSNLRMEAERAFVVLSSASGAQDYPAAKRIRNIQFRNVSGTVSEPSLIAGNAGGGVSGLLFDNIVFRHDCSRTLRIEKNPAAVFGEWNRLQPDGVFYIANASEIELTDVKVSCFNGVFPYSSGIVEYRTEKLRVNHCDFGLK